MPTTQITPGLICDTYVFPKGQVNVYIPGNGHDPDLGWENRRHPDILPLSTSDMRRMIVLSVLTADILGRSGEYCTPYIDILLTVGKTDTTIILPGNSRISPQDITYRHPICGNHLKDVGHLIHLDLKKAEELSTRPNRPIPAPKDSTEARNAELLISLRFAISQYVNHQIKLLREQGNSIDNSALPDLIEYSDALTDWHNSRGKFTFSFFRNVLQQIQLARSTYILGLKQFMEGGLPYRVTYDEYGKRIPAPGWPVMPSE